MGRGVEYLPACFSFQGGGGGNTDGTGNATNGQDLNLAGEEDKGGGEDCRLLCSALSQDVCPAPEEQLNCCKREGPGQGMNPNYHSTFRAVLTLTSPFKLAGIPAECFWKKRGGVLRSCFPPRGPSRRAFPDAVTPQSHVDDDAASVHGKQEGEFSEKSASTK